MFDIGFSELFVVAIVALIVLGPERLPKAARFAGLWVRRARAQWNSVKSEWENELADDDLKRSLRETREQLEQAQESLRDSGRRLQSEFESVRHGGRSRNGGAPPPPARDPGPAAPAEGDPDPAGPRRRDPADEPAVDEPGDAGESRAADEATADWREQQRREYEAIERELEAYDPAADDDDDAPPFGPRDRGPQPADERASGHAAAPGLDEPRPSEPRQPSRDHDRR